MMHTNDPGRTGQIFRDQKSFFSQQHTKNISFRKQALRSLRTWIEVHTADVAAALFEDLGKGPGEAYLTEIGLVLEELRIHISKVAKWSSPKRVLPALGTFPALARTVAEPYGAVLDIAPWNYPFLLAVKPLAGIISAGNTALIKPSELAPATAELIDRMITELFSPEYIAVVQGDKSAAEYLLSLPFDYIFYTGNPAVGRIVMEAAAKNLTPVTLELGGKSPLIVDENADLNIAARRIAWGKFINAGQTCIAPDHLYVHAAVRDRLLDRIRHYIVELYGDGMADAPYARIINERHYKRLCGYLNGQEIIWGGKRDEKSRVLHPVFINEPPADSPVMQEEIFGPILPVFTFNNLDEVTGHINSRPKPLAIYIFSRNRKKIRAMIRNTSSGAFVINDTLTQIANSRLPFGGVGQSGMGSYRGKYSFDTFSHKKSIITNFNFLDIPVRYGPYTPLKERLLRLFIR